MAECYCLGCGGIFEDGEKARVNEYGEPEMDGDLCPSCREAWEVGKRILGLSEEQQSGMPCGSEVDRLKSIIHNLDKKMTEAMIERNMAWESLRKISKLYSDDNTGHENAMDAYDAKMIAINTLKGSGQ